MTIMQVPAPFLGMHTGIAIPMAIFSRGMERVKYGFADDIDGPFLGRLVSWTYTNDASWFAFILQSADIILVRADLIKTDKDYLLVNGTYFVEVDDPRRYHVSFFDGLIEGLTYELKCVMPYDEDLDIDQIKVHYIGMHDDVPKCDRGMRYYV